MRPRPSDVARPSDDPGGWMSVPLGMGIAQRRAGEREAVVLGHEHRRRLGEALLVDRVEEVVEREQPDAAADHRLVVEGVRQACARQRLDQRVPGGAIGKQQPAGDLELARRDLRNRVGRVVRLGLRLDRVRDGRVEPGEVPVLRFAHAGVELEPEAQVERQPAVDRPVVLDEHPVRPLVVVAFRRDLELARRVTRPPPPSPVAAVGRPSRNCAQDWPRSLVTPSCSPACRPR